jgi:hypothetical protein
MDRRRPKLRSISPAPISRTNASAISQTTRAFRTRCDWRPAVPLRPPSFRLSLTSPRENRQAGRSPDSIPVTIDNTPVKSSARMSTPSSLWRGMDPGGRTAFNTVTSAYASARPMAPPVEARSPLSVIACLMSCHRVAPSARRTAISRVLPDARASNRLAMLAHAIKSTKLTVPNNTRSILRMSPTTRSRKPTTATPSFALESGYCWARRSMIAESSAWACGTETPGFKRANTRSVAPVRSVLRSLSVRGDHISAAVTHTGANRKVSGIIPITV